MNVRDAGKRQYQAIINDAVQRLGKLHLPPEGWITTWRKALGMSGRQLSERVGVSKASIHQSERKERDGAVTIKHMEKLATALGGKFVFAIVPLTSTDDIIRAQAVQRAETIITRASGHMALEAQAMPENKGRDEIQRLADRLMLEMPSDFWEKA